MDNRVIPEWPGTEPDEVVLDFLATLPATIKEAVMAGCIIAFGLSRLDPQQNRLADLREYIKDGSALRRPYQCAMLIGAIELTLEHDEGDEEYYQQLWTHGIEDFRNIALRAPLRDKHYQTAHKAFSELREGKISPRTLYIWQGFLMAINDI
jgi:hypothetical protein